MKLRDMALCALFAALIAICAWISIPLPEISFTMQTFAVFLTLGLLGGKRGTLACVVYLLLGAVGLPVFTGFKGGIGALMGPTGGYILGFLASALLYWLLTALWGDRPAVQLLAMIFGHLLCYAFGSVWFLILYLHGGKAITLAAVLAKCVVPFLLPDGVKIALAFLLTRRLKRFLILTSE